MAVTMPSKGAVKVHTLPRAFRCQTGQRDLRIANRLLRLHHLVARGQLLGQQLRGGGLLLARRSQGMGRLFVSRARRGGQREGQQGLSRMNAAPAVTAMDVTCPGWAELRVWAPSVEGRALP
jgi:hypothetical protein